MRARDKLFITIGASEIIRLSGWTAPLSLRAVSEAAPEAIAALIRQVERESELVPGVRHVTVLERSEPDQHQRMGQNGRGELNPVRATGWIRYEVEGVAYGLPWRVRFRKAWEGNRHFWWRAEGGTGRPEQHGALWLIPCAIGTRLELRAQTRSALPILGGAATLLVNPLFVRGAADARSTAAPLATATIGEASEATPFA